MYTNKEVISILQITNEAAGDCINFLRLIKVEKQ